MIPNAKKAAANHALQASGSRDSLRHPLRTKKKDLRQKASGIPLSGRGRRRTQRRERQPLSGWDRKPNRGAYDDEITMATMTVLDCWLFF